MLNLFQHLSNKVQNSSVFSIVGKILKQVQNDIGYIKQRKCAFTLAEVLITLVIIGVIAAITIPSLIAKYQEQQLKTQFRKAYSTVTNALNKTVLLDFYGNIECYKGDNGIQNDTSQCNLFFNKFTNNLNVIKTCDGNAKQNGCVPQYSNYSTSLGCVGYTENAMNLTNKVYVLNDGEIFIRYGSSSGTSFFAIDINGFKGPNKYGYDLFDFSINKDIRKGMYISDSACYTPDAGGRTTEQMIKYAFSQ